MYKFLGIVFVSVANSQMVLAFFMLLAGKNFELLRDMSKGTKICNGIRCAHYLKSNY
jgi:hypothetical protein